MTNVINELFIQALLTAKTSRDTRTQVGSLLLTSQYDLILTAANDFANGLYVENSDIKNTYITHSETKLICKAAKFGLMTEGCTLLSTWACCENCAKVIVESGIKKVITHQTLLMLTPEKWKPSVQVGHEILYKGGVELVVYKQPIGEVEILFNGEKVTI